MRTTLRIWIAATLLAATAAAQQSAPQDRQTGGHQPPPQAYTDCKDKQAGDTVQHQTPEGTVPAVCEQSPQGLVARPKRSSEAPRPERTNPSPRPSAAGGGHYSIEQATSDRAQLHTVAFSALAFLTGDFAHDTFLPPGKVSDYFGFQYLRDIDANAGGHNTSFLTKVALNVLAILDANQRAQLESLARAQQVDIRQFAVMRFPLMAAFRRNLAGNLPAGANGLSREAIIRTSAELYELDGRLAYQRAQVMAKVILSLSPAQRAALAMMQFGDSRTWPEVQDRRRSGLPHEVDVAVMTYASELFSWQGGSIEADTYFCPERHGMYFGGFGLKTAPAMGKQNYSISTALTGDAGETFLALLNYAQRQRLLDVLELQRPALREIVTTRRAIAGELRRLLAGQSADESKVIAWSRRYGVLDGELSYLYANAFAAIGKTVSPEQRSKMASMRVENASDPKGPFLYSTLTPMPVLPNTDRLFSGAR